MLDAAMQAQLKTYLGNLREGVELVASLDDSEKSRQSRQLIEQIAAQHDLVTARFDGTDDRKPSFVIRRASDANKWVRFAGLPMGHEFTSLVLALLWAGGHPPKVDADLIEQVRALEGDFNFEMFFSLTCHNCPDVVQALTLMALENPRITATLIEGGTFQDEVERRDIMAVPATFLNGEPFYNGKMELAEILSKLDVNADKRAAEKLAAKAPFEVLVVGGGPAGAAAAVYTARKGFSTGIAAERFGGQLMDTLGIENLPGTPLYRRAEADRQPESPRQRIRNRPDGSGTRCGTQACQGCRGYHEVVMANGASLRARSLILSTGARWRNLGVPGEAEHRQQGRGLLPALRRPTVQGQADRSDRRRQFRRREAAIDLAKIVGHVTLIEFDTKLRRR